MLLVSLLWLSLASPLLVSTTKLAEAVGTDSTTAGLAEQLALLAQLHRDGDLSSEEFSHAKRTLLLKERVAVDATPTPTPHNAGPGYNVRDFGAKGDGRADDTAAFTRAFAAAVLTYKELNCGKGCGRSIADVFVPSGMYRLTGPIDVGGRVPGANMKYLLRRICLSDH